MKLMLCVRCNDVFKLGMSLKRCECGSCGGMYLADGFNSVVFGEKNKAFCLGFANSSLLGALGNQISSGDLPKTMPYGSAGLVSPGREFSAFVIPESAPSVKWFADESELSKHQ